MIRWVDELEDAAFFLLVVVVLAVLLASAGCNALGGIPSDTLSKAKDSEAGCVRADSLVMGKGVVTFANSSLKGSSIKINPETCEISVTNSFPPPAMPAGPPAAVSSETTSRSTTTNKTIQKSP